ncbi:MAG: MmcB family DNA repair protein [Pseudomonadota bacterium]
MTSPEGAPAAQADPVETGSRPRITTAVTRGTRRHFAQSGHATVTELSLKGGRRADIMAIDAKGIVTIVEVKSSIEDFRTDGKWFDYGPFCDLFYFAVPAEFPLDLIPDHCGLIIADAYEAVIEREPEQTPLSGARRKAVLLRFAQATAGKLWRLEDPQI